MAFTHVYRAMEIPSLTVIPYEPKPQKPSNSNVHNLPSKPFVRQPNSLNASKRTDSGESLVRMLPKSSLLVKDGENCEAAAGNAVSRGNSPKCAQGMRSD
jgi:hypothetical protein